MALDFEFVELDRENYKFLQEEIEKINPLENVSSLYLYLWKYYGIKIFFKINLDSIYFICKANKEIKINDETIIFDYFSISPILKNTNDLNKHLHNIVSYFKKISSQKICYIDRIKNDLINLIDFKNVKNVSEISYIYELDQLKYFPGKKMQKKRNLLNFFNKTYLQDITTLKYDSSYMEEILLFCNEHIKKYSDIYREHEYLGIQELLKIERNNKNIVGSIVKYKNLIIGVTLGYMHNNYYEIFLEKFSRDFKGGYQFIISQNLVLNNISNPFIDRQDSESIQGLMESKKSYKPIKIILGSLIEVKI